jgi:hypothetical protein
MGLSKPEVAELLALAQAADGRPDVGKASVEAWHAILPGWLTWQEAYAALTAYFAGETRRIMPADVIGHAREARLTWLDAHPGVGPAHPEIVPPWEQNGRELES